MFVAWNEPLLEGAGRNLYGMMIKRIAMSGTDRSDTFDIQYTEV